MKVMAIQAGRTLEAREACSCAPKQAQSSKIDEHQSNFQRFSERNISQPVPAINYPVMKAFSLFNLNLLPLKESTLCKNYSNKFWIVS